MRQPLLTLLVCIGAAIACAPAIGQAPPAAKAQAVQRHSAERPTALPEDRELAEQFARAAAGYTTHVRLLMAANADTGKALALTNWLYFNAIDLSDETFAKTQFTRHVRALADLALKVDRARSSEDRGRVDRVPNAFTASLNQHLEEGELLFAKYEKTFNSVVQNADGSFTVQAR